MGFQFFRPCIPPLSNCDLVLLLSFSSSIRSHKVSNGQVIQLKSSEVKYLKRGQVSLGKSSILGIGQVKNEKTKEC